MKCSGKSSPRCVWLVEDNPTDIFVIENLLRSSGLQFEIRPIEHGERALEFIADETAQCPDLILLDLNMPRVSGLEVLQALRASARCAHIPVVVITSSQSPEDREATAKFGANAFFTKPGNLKEYEKLIDVIESFLGTTGK